MIESGLALFGLFCLLGLTFVSIYCLIEWSSTRASIHDLHDLRDELIRRINEPDQNK